MKYAIGCTARSGSTYLARLLNSSGVMGDPREFVRPEEHIGDEESSKNKYREILEKFTVDGVFGFKGSVRKVKWFHQHVRFDKYILLTRNDVILQAISRQVFRNHNLQHTKVLDGETYYFHRIWEGVGGEWRKERPQIPDSEYSRKEISARIKQIQKEVRILRSMLIEPLEVVYEDVCRDELGSVQRIADFADIACCIAYRRRRQLS